MDITDLLLVLVLASTGLTMLLSFLLHVATKQIKSHRERLGTLEGQVAMLRDRADRT
jgi:hypothetical protein